MSIPENEDEKYKEFRNYATQFANAISYFPVDDGQWVGRLIRVYGELKAPDGTLYGGIGEGDTKEAVDRDTANKFNGLKQFLIDQKITDLEIGGIAYEPDPDDQLYSIARGYIDIKKSEGNALRAGYRYNFEHRIKKTYHTKKTVLEEVGPIPESVAGESGTEKNTYSPSSAETDSATDNQSKQPQ